LALLGLERLVLFVHRLGRAADEFLGPACRMVMMPLSFRSTPVFQSTAISANSETARDEGSLFEAMIRLLRQTGSAFVKA
jgi:hypothetical protein